MRDFSISKKKLLPVSPLKNPGIGPISSGLPVRSTTQREVQDEK